MTTINHLEEIIETAFSNSESLSPKTVSSSVESAIQDTLNLLDKGEIRVAEKQNSTWIVHQWIKKAILLAFKVQPNQMIDGHFTHFFDKWPLKFTDYNENMFQQSGVRVVPPACVRFGAFINRNSILMPSYVNMGAYIDSGTMVDTWATVGSCAQIGKNVHLSGGVGIGGVLEPLQANPTIIEDDCFIGARSEVVEGVIVEQGAVLSMGVYIGQSTPIYHRDTHEIMYGKVPAGSVVVPGTIPAKNGRYGLYAAIIVKQVDAKTRQKVSVNELLRGEHYDQ
jgi:2,3,4,5-tetrahydropyridine-2-carboxylate N-succinyltransferase